MHHDQISLLLRLVEEFRDRAENKRVTDSVKSIFPQSMRLGYLLVDWICLHMFGERLMECAIEVGDVLEVGEILPTCPDNFEGGKVVPGLLESSSLLVSMPHLQWRQILNSLQRVIGLVINLYGPGIIPSMNNPMTDIRQVVTAGDL